MNKKIFRNLVYISLLSLLLSTAISLVINYNNYKKNTEKNLSTVINIVEKNLTNRNEEKRYEYLNEISHFNKEIRISYFHKDGSPIFDSFVDAESLENHKDREEIKGAKEFGRYNSNRYSSTLSKETYYLASELKDGTILRLSMENDNIIGAFLNILPLTLITIILLFILSILLSRYATKKILEPLESFDGDIDKVDLDKIPEISPFISEISSQKETIALQLEEIKRERDKLMLILENMREGLLILDLDKSILSINKEAIKILECGENPLNKNIIYATRREELLSSLEEAYKGNASSGKIEVEDRMIKYYINPVYYEEKITGSIILLIDETKRLRAEKIREEFSANVSHELKTPLTSICGFAELLKNNMVEEKDQEEIINSIFEESKRLLGLIDEIIKISKLEEGRQFVKEEIDLSKLVEEVISDFTNKAEEKNIKFSKSGNAILYSNPVMIWEVISNLVDNAIKYNVEGGKIDINLEETSKEVKISVKDTGIGIDKKDIDRIFERFYRVDKSRFKKRGGTGLGLSIVKHIVKNHGGNIEVESQLNQGTTIKINIPK